jgi:lysozyme family protein
MTFDESCEQIIRLEGGSKITDDPSDPGGLTKYGISLRANPELGESGIRKLTKAKAKAIYKEKYWTPSRAQDMPDVLRLPLFDSAVNQGVTGSAKLLQRALNELGYGLKVDGKIGPRTMAAVKKANDVELAAVFLRQRILAYRADRNYERFGAGWERRVFIVALVA